MNQTVNIIDRQTAHVAKLVKENFRYGLTAGAAFVRGIRKVGYKHTGTALDELVDNSFEADASFMHVAFGFAGKSDKKPSHLAVIDDGAGMIPGMLRVAALWGGTDREDSRTGIGRFGYGLPSAAMSQGKRFEVYSKPRGGEWNVVVIDLDEIEKGEFSADNGDIVVPPAKAASLPLFVRDYIKANLPGGELEHGTVVVLTKLDNLTWSTANALRDNLLKHFGVTYHKLRARIDIVVDGTRCDPIDPLFLTPGYRWYDLDAQKAQAFDPLVIEVKDRETKEPLGVINVRYSYMPSTFASVDKSKKAVGKNQNQRFWVLKEYNGFIICRMGRVIDVIRSSPLLTFVNNDRYLKIEVDFDARLDEEFNVPTNKQRVDISDRIWEVLEDHGLLKAVEQLRKKFGQDSADLITEQDVTPGTQRVSEKAMERAAILDIRPTSGGEERRQAEGERKLQQEAERRSAASGRPLEDERRTLEAEYAGKAYRVAKESVPGGNFFRMEQIGGTKVLFLNTSTRFFTEVYAGPESSPTLRSALEVLLFGIGDRILDARDELRDIYASEVPEWSKKIEFALGQLQQFAGTVGVDEAEHADAAFEVEAAVA